MENSILKELRQLQAAMVKVEAAIYAAIEAYNNRPRRYWEENPEMIITKQQAREMGLPRYRTGHACPAGHKGWRYMSTGGCILCQHAGRSKINGISPQRHRLALGCVEYARVNGTAMRLRDARGLTAEELAGVKLEDF